MNFIEKIEGYETMKVFSALVETKWLHLYMKVGPRLKKGCDCLQYHSSNPIMLR